MLQPSIIYHGVFGSGFFQKLYSPMPAHALMLCTSLEYHTVINLPLLLLGLSFPVLLPLACASIALSISVCILAAAQATLPRKQKRFWSRPLIAALFFLQPLVRGWARYRTMLHLRGRPRKEGAAEPADLSALDETDQLCFWSRTVDRYSFLRALLAQLKQWK